MKRSLAILLVLLLILGAAGYYAYERFFPRTWVPDGLVQGEGEIESEPLEVIAKSSGRLLEFLVSEGDSVQRGQIVARLEDPLARARQEQAMHTLAVLEDRVRSEHAEMVLLEARVPLQIRAAQAGVTHAQAVADQVESIAAERQAEVDRLREVEEPDEATKQQLALAEAAVQASQQDLVIAHAALGQAEADLDLARLGTQEIAAQITNVQGLEGDRDKAKVELEAAQGQLAEMGVTSSVAGTVIARAARIGDTISPGSPLLDLIDFDALFIRVDFSDVEVANLHSGQPAKVYPDAFPDADFEATVRGINSSAELPRSRTRSPGQTGRTVFSVKLWLDANPGHILMPGMQTVVLIRVRDDAPWVRPPRPKRDRGAGGAGAAGGR